MNESELNKLFEQAKAEPPQPSSDFLARVLSDAEAMQPAPRGVAPARQKSLGASLRAGFGQFGELIGGWPAMAGLASAAVAGVWIGVSQPQILSDPLMSMLGNSMDGSYDLLMDSGTDTSGFDFSQFEG